MENILSKKQKKHLKKTYLNTEKKIRNRIASNRKAFYCGIAVLAVLTAYSLFKPKEQQAVIPQVNQDYENCMSWNRSNSINRKQYLSPVQINGVVVDSAVNDFCATDKNRNRVSSEQNGLWLNKKSNNNPPFIYFSEPLILLIILFCPSLLTISLGHLYI